MNGISLPLIELGILAPFAGAILVSRVRDAQRARLWALAFCTVTLVCTLASWHTFSWSGLSAAHDRWDLVYWLTGQRLFVIDELSAPLLPLAALLYLLTTIATLRTKIRRFSFTAALLAEAILLATLSCRLPLGVIALLAVGTVPPYLELLDRGKPARVYALHMGLFVASLLAGWLLIQIAGDRSPPAWALAPLVLAVLIRSGIAPFHCWVTDLFEHATFGRALLFVTPMMGAYAAVRLLLPFAPDWLLRSVGTLALATALYAAAMALVQREVRRWFAYIFLSHSALVLVGLDTLTPIGLTGALTVWLSVGLSLAGFGLTLRALEARHGRLSLSGYYGVYEHTPDLAVCFLLTGLASVGFPGTFGFLSTELLADGAVQAFPYVGIAVVLAAALNGIAVLHAYFRLFNGTRLVTSIPLQVGLRERLAVLTMAALVLGGGIYPQPGVSSRSHAAKSILENRVRRAPPGLPSVSRRTPDRRMADAAP